MRWDRSGVEERSRKGTSRNSFCINWITEMVIKYPHNDDNIYDTY